MTPTGYRMTPSAPALQKRPGLFTTDYLRSDFEKTPFSPAIDIELIGDPNVYFSVRLGSSVILAEDRWRGRTPGARISATASASTFARIKSFSPPSSPSPIGSGSGIPAFTRRRPTGLRFFARRVRGRFGQSLCVLRRELSRRILLRGNCPLTNVAAPVNSLEYRFVIGEWTWLGGGDGDTRLCLRCPWRG